MKLTVIGCSGSAPGPGTAASCYLVEAEGYRLLLDLGSGALAALQRVLRVDEIDAIFLSHLHPDHCVDMASLAVILRFGLSGDGGPGDGRRGDIGQGDIGQGDRGPGDRGSGVRTAIPVIGPAGSAEHLLDIYYPGSPPSTFTGLFEFQVPDAHQLGPFTVHTVAVRHPVPAFAVRVEAGGRSLVYSGDTAATPALVELARRADVLLCEAAWAGSSPPVPGIHLSGREAGEHAAQAGVGRLLITHIPAWESVDSAVAGARETFGGDVVGVAPGETYDV